MQPNGKGRTPPPLDGDTGLSRDGERRRKEKWLTLLHEKCRVTSSMLLDAQRRGMARASEAWGGVCQDHSLRVPAPSSRPQTPNRRGGRAADLEPHLIQCCAVYVCVRRQQSVMVAPPFLSLSLALLLSHCLPLVTLPAFPSLQQPQNVRLSRRLLGSLQSSLCFLSFLFFSFFLFLFLIH